MKAKYIVVFMAGAAILASCGDILESESNRQIYDPALDEKTDSIFYTLGILKSMQQAADQYVMYNVMRGDLSAVNTYTETDLRELADFSAGTDNKFDSAYVYYRIVNNCNYYITHRDTSLRTGSRQVAIAEYVEAKALRAWAYLQLVRTYGTVPFYTYPITAIGQVEEVTETVDRSSLCDMLAPDLAPYSGTIVPSYGSLDAGESNSSGTKTVTTSLCMIPVDIILGDLYLEANNYNAAAYYLSAYLINKGEKAEAFYVSPETRGDYQLPTDLSQSSDYITGGTSWSAIFSANATTDIISYIPMAVNRLEGTVTELTTYFGYDYYSTSEEISNTTSGSRYLLERQIDPSDNFYDLSDAQTYYYVPSTATTASVVSETDLGDMRRYAYIEEETQDDSSFSCITKLNNTNIPLYRVSTVYLKLAEALNRMGYCDAAFAILKDGIDDDLLDDTTYITDQTKTLLEETLPFLSSVNISNFSEAYGIHHHGAGYVEGSFSGYQMSSVIGDKLEQKGITADSLFWTVWNSDENLPYVIDALEDIICDEMALESSFEGSRFSDLMRIALHKNASSPWGSNYGSAWLAEKLSYKSPAVDLTDESNWYMKMQ